MGSRGGWAQRIPHARSAPMYLIHAVALVGPFLVRFSWNYVWMAVALYVARMALLSGGYHRYFAHRAYKTSRVFQFVLAWLGCTRPAEGAAVVGGPPPAPPPVLRHARRTRTRRARTGFWWSHVGWILSESTTRRTEHERSPTSPGTPSCAGWTATTSCRPGCCLGVLCFLLGGWSGLVWGFVVRTVLL